MKNKQPVVFILLVLLIGLISYIVYDKFSFTEDMARSTAKKFFNLLMTRGNEGFKEIYPNINDGTRIVTNKLCRINNITKRDDGNYEVFASYEPSQLKSFPISIVVNRNGQVESSKGISYAYFDRTFEYGKKLGCLTGDEDDLKMELIIKDKKLRTRLNNETDLAIYSIYEKLNVRANVESNYGITSGNVIVTNKSPYDLKYGEVSCKVNYYNSRGEIIESDDVLIINIGAFESISSSTFANSNSIVSYKTTKDIIPTDDLKSRVKDQIIKRADYGCY